MYNLVFISNKHSSVTVTHIMKFSPQLVQLLYVNTGRYCRIIGYVLNAVLLSPWSTYTIIENFCAPEGLSWLDKIALCTHGLVLWRQILLFVLMVKHLINVALLTNCISVNIKKFTLWESGDIHSCHTGFFFQYLCDLDKLHLFWVSFSSFRNEILRLIPSPLIFCVSMKQCRCKVT